MKQRQVADALGVSRSAYTNYEAGARCPDADMLTKMADFFEISVDEILGHTPKQSKDFRLQPRELYSGTLVKTKIDKFLNVSGSRHCSIEQQCREVALCWRDVPDG